MSQQAPPLTAADCLRSTATEWGSSRWAVHGRCGREYELRYVKGVRRLPMARQESATKPSALNVGSLVHAGIRLVETGAMAPQEAIAALQDAAAQEGQRFSALDIAEASRLLTAYWDHYGDDNALAPGWPAQLAVEGTEVQLKATGLQHTGAIDTLLRHESGELLIVDTKTRSAKLHDDAERLFATNPQFLSLSYMLQEARDLETPPPLIVNAIVKTKVPSFERVTVRFTQAQVDQWAENQRNIETRDELMRAATGPYAMNYYHCAPTVGYKCDFFDYCHAPSEEARGLHFTEVTTK